MIHPNANAGLRLLNELPKPYATWLAFYDSLPAELLADKDVQVRQLYNPNEFFAVFGERTSLTTEVTWIIDRDYYLARVAEALLPSRYSQQELRMLEAALYNNHKMGNSPAPDPASFVSRLYGVVLLG